MFDNMVVTKVARLVQDLREKVFVWRIIHNDICVVEVLYNAVEGDDGRVGRGDLVQRNFAHMELSAARRLAVAAAQAFHRVRPLRPGECLDGAVHDAIAAHTEDCNELEAASIDERAQRWVGGVGGRQGGPFGHRRLGGRGKSPLERGIKSRPSPVTQGYRSSQEEVKPKWQKLFVS